VSKGKSKITKEQKEIVIMLRSVINRISKLEKRFPIANFDAQELFENVISEIETVLQYNIKDRYVCKISKSISRCKNLIEMEM